VSLIFFFPLFFLFLASLFLFLVSRPFPPLTALCFTAFSPPILESCCPRTRFLFFFLGESTYTFPRPFPPRFSTRIERHCRCVCASRERRCSGVCTSDDASQARPHTLRMPYAYEACAFVCACAQRRRDRIRCACHMRMRHAHAYAPAHNAGATSYAAYASYACARCRGVCASHAR
jgi:hypothetical protein